MAKNMFDKYFICDGTLCNVMERGKIIGFRIGVKVSYYRGVFLAVVNDFTVTVDGVEYTSKDMTFTIKEGTFTFDQMKGDMKHHWDFGETAYLTVRKDGGLSEGTHRVRVYEEIRIVNGLNIDPVMFVADWEKEMELCEPLHLPPKIRRGVSFYSYQDEWYLGEMGLEECIKDVTDMGADGIEIISEALIPEFPNPPQAWVDHWFSLLSKYGAVPVCYDMFMDGQIISGEDITEEQAVEIMETNIKLAARLGFEILRVIYTIPLDIIRKALPCAEKYGVIMGLEIHPPFKLKTQQVDQYIDFIKETGTKNFGIIPDFGIFMEKTVPSMEEKAVKRGANPENAAFVSKCYAKRMDYESMMEQLKEMQPNTRDWEWAKEVFGLTYCDPELLADYIPYIVHVHAKVFDMVEGEDPSVDNETIIRILKENGWEGYICTEYEGQRTYHDIEGWSRDNIGLIHEHHKMLKKYIEK